MAPEGTKILGLISKEDKMDEIQRRLQEQEARKARKLLAMAYSHKDALFITKNIIEEQLAKLNGHNKHK